MMGSWINIKGQKLTSKFWNTPETKQRCDIGHCNLFKFFCYSWKNQVLKVKPSIMVKKMQFSQEIKIIITGFFTVFEIFNLKTLLFSKIEQIRIKLKGLIFFLHLLFKKFMLIFGYLTEFFNFLSSIWIYKLLFGRTPNFIRKKMVHFYNHYLKYINDINNGDIFLKRNKYYNRYTILYPVFIYIGKIVK